MIFETIIRFRANHPVLAVIGKAYQSGTCILALRNANLQLHSLGNEFRQQVIFFINY
jgi:hypothetical protein